MKCQRCLSHKHIWHYTITEPDMINELYIEIEHEENQDSNSPDTTTYDIVGDDNDDGSSDDDKYSDEDDNLDNSDDNQSEEFDLSQKWSNNKLQVED